MYLIFTNFKTSKLNTILFNLGIVLITILNVFNGNTQPCTIGSPSAITGTTTGLCVNGITNSTYSIDVVNGATNYVWTVPFGTSIVEGQGTNSITIAITSNFSSGTISVVASNECVSSSFRFLTIRSVPTSTGTISGISTGLCANDIDNPIYSIAAVTGATSYVWSTPTGTTIISGQGTTSVSLDISNTFLSGSLTVAASNECGLSPVRSITLKSAVPLIPASISGITIGLCDNGINNPSYSIPEVTNATSYEWIAPLGTTIISGQGTNSISLNITNSFTSGSLKVTAINECGSSPGRSLTLKSAIPSTPGLISGVTAGLCENGINNPIYSIPEISGATNYVWTAPAGATIISGQGTTSITLNITNSFTSGSLKVAATNDCGSSQFRSLTLKSAIPSTPGAISGMTTGLCSSGITTPTYSISGITGATNYMWTAPAGATIISGQGTTSITLNISNSFTSGVLTVAATNDCGSSSLRSMSLTSSLLTPASIIGSTTPCGTETYICPSVTNANSYIWAVPNGMEIVSGQGTTSITVNAVGSSISGNISVKASNNCKIGGTRALAINSCNSSTKVDEPLYMELTNEIDVIVFPNPINEEVNIQLSKELDENINVEIFNMIGKKVSQVEIYAGYTFANITLEGIPSGVYLLQASKLNGALIYKTKLLKQ